MASNEKHVSAIDTTRVSDSGSPQPSIRTSKVKASNWRPGYRARFPTMGFLGILGVVVCAVINIAVLIGSNGVSSSVWPGVIAPHTIVNTIQSVSSLCLALAIAEGVSIAWWRKALRGATVAELHQSWSFSMSFSQIVKHFWALDVIALAALATKMAILDSFLFQNAAITETYQDPAKNVTLLGAASQVFPQTGYVVAQGFSAQTSCSCFMIGDTYTPTVDSWETSNGYFQNVLGLFQKCDGICYTYVDAIGFEIDCQKTSNHTNYASGAIAAFDANLTTGIGDPNQWTNLPIFNSSFGVAYPDATTNYTQIMMNLLYFDSDNPYDSSSASCPGTITNVQCALRPALVRYPLTIVNYTNPHITNGVSIGGRPHDDSNTMAPPIPDYSYTTKQAEGFQVLSYLETNDQNVVNTTTQLGGIANALSQFMSSTATISYTGSAIWGLDQKGTLAQTMMFGPPNMGSCDCSFRDALSTMVAEINQLTFLTATNQTLPPPGTPQVGTEATVIGVTDNTTTTYEEIPDALQITDVIHYKTLYLYLGLGAGSTLLCILLIIPAFWRYGELGRPVTLGPMEIASAFRAPMLETGQGDEEVAGNLDELIEKVGHRKVVYGIVEDPEEAATEHAAEEGMPATTTTTILQKRQSVRMGMGEPTKVRPVSGVWTSHPASPKVGTASSPRIGTPGSPRIPSYPNSPVSPSKPFSPTLPKVSDS